MCMIEADASPQSCPAACDWLTSRMECTDCMTHAGLSSMCVRVRVRLCLCFFPPLVFVFFFVFAQDEVTLYSNARERRQWDKLSEFFAIIKTTEHLENARIKSAVGRDEVWLGAMPTVENDYYAAWYDSRR